MTGKLTIILDSDMHTHHATPFVVHPWPPGDLGPMLLGDALRLMDKADQRGAPVPFSISWCTLDRKRGSGKEPGGMAEALKKAAELLG